MLWYRSVWCCGTGVCVMLWYRSVCDVWVCVMLYRSVCDVVCTGVCVCVWVCVMLWYRSVCVQECVWCCGTGVCVWCDVTVQECVCVCVQECVCDVVVQECVSDVVGSAAALLWVLYVTQSSSSSAQRCVFRAVAHCRPLQPCWQYWWQRSEPPPSAPAVGPSCSTAVSVQSDWGRFLYGSVSLCERCAISLLTVIISCIFSLDSSDFQCKLSPRSTPTETIRNPRLPSCGYKSEV